MKFLSVYSFLIYRPGRVPRKLSDRLCGYCQLLDRSALSKTLSVVFGALFILPEKRLCFFRFMIDFPASAYTRTAAALAVRIFDEPFYVFRRIPKKEPDLMRKCPFFPDPLDQMYKTPGRKG
jgi:hypothetical protein